MNKFLLRYFIDGDYSVRPEHQFEYNHAARMIIPRIGERVWLDDMLCVEVNMVTYSPNRENDGTVYLIDIEATDVTEQVMSECDDYFDDDYFDCKEDN